VLSDAAADAWGTLLAFQRLAPLHAAAALAGTLKAAPPQANTQPLPPLGVALAALLPMPTAAPSEGPRDGASVISQCRFFLSSQGCRFGAACRFQHET